MKNLFLIAVIVLGFSAASFAQNPLVSDVADASATIVSPLLINKTVDLVFGNVAVSAVDPGTVVMSTLGVRTNTDGVSLPATTGTFSAAEFTVTGEAGYSFTFTVPVDETVVDNGLGDEMIINTFTSNSSGVLTGGTQTVSVGATLNVGAGQATGVYESATPFEVTVNYN